MMEKINSETVKGELYKKILTGQTLWDIIKLI